MRYRLLPYLYTAMHSAHTTGAPAMRPLWLNFPEDPRTHKIDRFVAVRLDGRVDMWVQRQEGMGGFGPPLVLVGSKSYWRSCWQLDSLAAGLAGG